MEWATSRSLSTVASTWKCWPSLAFYDGGFYDLMLRNNSQIISQFSKDRFYCFSLLLVDRLWNWTAPNCLLETIQHHTEFVYGIDFNLHIPGQVLYLLHCKFNEFSVILIQVASVDLHPNAITNLKCTRRIPQKLTVSLGNNLLEPFTPETSPQAQRWGWRVSIEASITVLDGNCGALLTTDTRTDCRLYKGEQLKCLVWIYGDCVMCRLCGDEVCKWTGNDV